MTEVPAPSSMSFTTTSPIWLVPAGSAATTSTWASLPEISERDLAFLQYTSGTTGTPRGVRLAMDTIETVAMALAQAAGAEAADRAMALLPLSILLENIAALNAEGVVVHVAGTPGRDSQDLSDATGGLFFDMSVDDFSAIFDTIASGITVTTVTSSESALAAGLVMGVMIIPFVSSLMVKFGQAVDSVENGVRLLEQEELVGVFPERYPVFGRAQRDRFNLERFRSTAFVEMASKTGTPIIPVGIIYIFFSEKLIQGMTAGAVK